MYEALADAVLLAHLAVVLFVIGGVVAIVLGNLRGWRWVNALPFRVLHVAVIGIVVLQSWLGQICPLTTLESWLRRRAGAAAYTGGFIEHWVGQVLFYQAPGWIFTVSYSLFGAIIAATWWYFPPRRLQPPAATTRRDSWRSARHARQLESLPPDPAKQRGE